MGNVTYLLRQSKHGLEKKFQTQSISEGVRLLTTKSRQKVGIASLVGPPPDISGKANSFRELIADFYSLKTKKIPVGRFPLGDWLGCYTVFAGVESCPN